MTTVATPPLPDYSPEGFGQIDLSLAKGGSIPSGTYVTLDDQLYVRSVCSLAGVVVEVRARILTVTGQEIICANTHTASSNRTAVVTLSGLAEGFLLAVTAWVQSVTCLRGQCYVQVGLTRGTAAALQPHDLLIAEYVSTARAVSWPGDDREPATCPPGFTTTGIVGNPAAGADFGQVITPTGARWKLHSYDATLTSAVAAANRIPSMIITDSGGGTIARCTIGGVQTASLVVEHAWFRGAGATLQGLVGNGALPDELVMTAGARFATATQAIQAADQWSANHYCIEEWLEV